MPDLGEQRSIVQELSYQDVLTHALVGADEDNPIILARWKVTNNLPSGFDQLVGYTIQSSTSNGKKDGGTGNVFVGWTESDDNGATWSDDVRAFTTNPSFTFLAQAAGNGYLNINSNLTDIAFGIWGTDLTTLGTIREVVGILRLTDGDQFTFTRVK